MMKFYVTMRNFKMSHTIIFKVITLACLIQSLKFVVVDVMN